MKRNVLLLMTAATLLAVSCSKLDDIWKKGHGPKNDNNGSGLARAAHVYIGTTLTYDYSFSYDAKGFLTGAVKHQYPVSGAVESQSSYKFAYQNDSLRQIDVEYTQGSSIVYKQRYLFVQYDDVLQRQQINYDASTGFAADTLRVFYNFSKGSNGRVNSVAQTCIKGAFNPADPCIGSAVNDQFFDQFSYDAQNNVSSALHIYYGDRIPDQVSDWDSLKNPFAMKDDVLFLLNESVLADNQHFDILTNVINQNKGGQPAVYSRHLLLQTNNPGKLLYHSDDMYLSVSYDFSYSYKKIKGQNYPSKIEVNRTGELAASDPPKQDFLGSVSIDY